MIIGRAAQAFLASAGATNSERAQAPRRGKAVVVRWLSFVLFIIHSTSKCIIY